MSTHTSAPMAEAALHTLHVITIVAHFKMLCSFLLGAGVFVGNV